MDSITTEELKDKMNRGESFHLVNVLDEEDFKEEHIPGSVNIPLENIASEALENFEKDEEIIVYCTSELCTASPTAVEKLKDLGFENVVDYEDGTKGWKDAGLETVSA